MLFIILFGKADDRILGELLVIVEWMSGLNIMYSFLMKSDSLAKSTPHVAH